MPAAVTRAERPSCREVARLIAQAAEALAHAHAHGVVHRDVKPANLLLDAEGTLWVSDFGLARAEDSDELTRPGDVVGTLRYMAPERFRGVADARSDLYSLGMTLYELLALEPAFRASHREALLHAILHVEPRRPRAVDPRIPRDLETIVLRAIAKDPADRFASAGEMAAELRRFVEGLPIRSRRPAIPERLWRWSRRNPVPALLSLLAGLLAALLLIGSVASAMMFRRQRDAIVDEQIRTRAHLSRALAAERGLQAELGRSLRLQARELRNSGRPGRRAEGLRILAEAARIARGGAAEPGERGALRDEVIATLALDDIEEAGVRPAPDMPPRQSIHDLASDRYVVLRDDAAIHVRRLSDGSEVKVVRTGRPADRRWPWLVPGGRFVVNWAGPSVELWDLDRGEMPAAWPRDARNAAYRADGRQLAVLVAAGEIRRYDLPAMTESARVRLPAPTPARMIFAAMALSGDGRRVALAGQERWDTDVYDLDAGRLVRALKVPEPRVFGQLALDHSGDLLAFAHDRTISVHRVDDGEEIARLQGHEGDGLTSDFRPGGGLLATAGWDGMTRFWDPVRARPIAALVGGFLGWDGGGGRLTILRGRDLVSYRIASSDVRRTIDGLALGHRPVGGGGGPGRVEYSPDGRLIAMTFRPHGVRVLRASDGAPLAHLPIGPCDEAAFLPGGDLVTFNDRGVDLWPARRLGGAVRLGPPEHLAQPEQLDHWFPVGLAVAAGARLVGVCGSAYPGAVLLVDPDRPRRRTRLVPHPRVAGAAISPDGRWAATVDSANLPDGRRVHIWDASSGRRAASLDVGVARVAFSPDGRWLGVSGAGSYRFLRAGTWEVVARFEHGQEVGRMAMAFHPGGRVAAVLTEPTATRAGLVEVETGRILAALEAPEPASTHCLTFSPDGRYLAAARSDQRVHIWDLARLRARLDELGLVADLPDALDGGRPAPDVDRIEVLGADPAELRWSAIRQVLRRGWSAFRAMSDAGLDDPDELGARGRRWQALGHPGLAEADYRASLARRPDSAFTAHLLARCVIARDGDLAEALLWARAAAALQPEILTYRSTLGAALYGAGRLEDAAAALEANIPIDPDDAGPDWLFLAMTRQRMGRTAGARDALAEAGRWRAARPAMNRERSDWFRRALREAESLLAATPPDLPEDVFAR